MQDNPQASPTIQELLAKAIMFPEPEDIDNVLAVFSRIITEARPPIIDTDNRQKVYERDEAQQWYDKGQNDTIQLFERNLRAAIAKDQPID